MTGGTGWGLDHRAVGIAEGIDYTLQSSPRKTKGGSDGLLKQGAQDDG